MTREGLILKGVAGVYDVLCGDEVIALPAAGKFRKRHQAPMVGDRVFFESDGAVTRIAPRKNELVRPPLANVDALIVTVAIRTPEPDWKLADKMICFCRMRGITPILCINKSDLDQAAASRAARAYETCGVRAVCTGLSDPDSVQTLKEAIPQGIVCFAGQSAVGKSSLTNALIGNDRFETGGLSKKTERGRHTTRHCELVRLKEGTFLADTPGFSLLEVPLLDPEVFRDLYAEFLPYAPSCRFHGCFHDKEPDCAVKQAVADGALPEERYHRYLELLNDVKEKWGNRYD